MPRPSGSLSREVVAQAHARCQPVEAEQGALLGGRDAAAIEWVAANLSAVDVLDGAVAPGNVDEGVREDTRGVLLSLADGSLTVEAILDASGLPRLLALRHLRGLVDRGLLSPASGYRRPPVPLAAQAWADRKDPKRRDPA